MNKKIGLSFAVLVLSVVLLFAGLGINKCIYNSKASQACKAAAELLQQKDYQGAMAAYENILSEFSKSKFALKAELGLAEAYLKLGKLAEARDLYKNVLSQEVDLKLARAVNERLGDLNIKVLFSPARTKDSIIYKVQDEDTLQSIAKKYGATVSLIKRANGIKTQLIRPGMSLKIPAGDFSIVVDKSQNILTLKSKEEVVKTYMVSTGADNSTPAGTFKIVNKIIDPPWFSEGKVIPPGDPKNVLGSRWMGLTIKGYGIHGTTDDASIGKQCTQGCVRMHNPEVEELYDIVPVGTEVTILD